MEHEDELLGLESDELDGAVVESRAMVACNVLPTRGQSAIYVASRAVGNICRVPRICRANVGIQQ